MSITKNNKEMEVFIYDWRSIEKTEKGNFSTELRFYGIDLDGCNTCVRIEDFRSRLTIEFINHEDYLVNNFSLIKNKLSSIIYNNADKNSIKIVHKRKLYGSYINTEDNTHKTFPYLEIYFTSRIAMMSFKKKIHTLDLKCNVKFHECDVKPEIQFIVERDITPSGWVIIKGAVPVSDVDEKITQCQKEYIISKEQVHSSERTDLVNPKILSWDIEAKCKNIGKDPGMDVNDCVFQISCVFFLPLTNKFKKYLLTLGECDEFADDVKIIKYKKEKDLILGFTELIRSEQPNGITGWNIFNFDFTFMINRAEHNMCLGEFSTMGFVDSESEIKTLKWTSKAFSTTDIKFISPEGIVTIDLIDVVRKEYKLDSYSLNNVSKHFLKEQKDDITFKDLMIAYDHYLNNTNEVSHRFALVGKYCVQDSKLVADLFIKLQTWVALSEMARTTSTPIINVHINGQQRKFYNQVYRYCYYNNIVVESDVYHSSEKDRYAGAYVIDPVPGLYEYVVPLDFASLYPSIIEAYNFDYTTMVSPIQSEKLDESTLTVLDWEDHIGCKHDPLVIKKNTLDRLIENKTKQIKEEKLKNKNKNYNNDMVYIKKLQKERAEIVSKNNKKVMCQHNKFKFLKQEIYGKGVLPTIIENLLLARKTVRQQMKTVKDPFLLALLNQRQLSYKVSANSMYGATGVKSGALPFMPIAMCVTYTGRESIKKASTILKSLGGTIVYGDTDSNYVMFKDIQGDHKTKCAKTWEYAEKVADEISSHYPSPMRIEFEQVIYYKFMILTKKRYMYYSCNKEGDISTKIGQKGVLLVRRDHSSFVKNIYEDIVMRVFDGQSKENCINAVIDHITKLMTFQTDASVLQITKSVNDYDGCELRFDQSSGKYYMGNYIVPSPPLGLSSDEITEYCMKRLPAQVQLEIKMINRGEEKSEGSRLGYIVTNKYGCKKQCEKIEDYKFYCANKRMFKIDYMYYIERLIDPLEQIFDSIFHTEEFVDKSLKIFKTKQKLNLDILSVFCPKINIEK
ncbi:dna polymerase [Dasineura jujubifolia toursvirus 2a]|nr:dna polymerase [Dasineura jujubifolia toursvirus 2a]